MTLNCKRHKGKGTSKNCPTCKLEKKFNEVLSKPEFAFLNPF